jgi:hypothetical protein
MAPIDRRLFLLSAFGAASAFGIKRADQGNTDVKYVLGAFNVQFKVPSAIEMTVRDAHRQEIEDRTYSFQPNGQRGLDGQIFGREWTRGAHPREDVVTYFSGVITNGTVQVTDIFITQGKHETHLTRAGISPRDSENQQLFSAADSRFVDAANKLEAFNNSPNKDTNKAAIADPDPQARGTVLAQNGDITLRIDPDLANPRPNIYNISGAAVAAIPTDPPSPPSPYIISGEVSFADMLFRDGTPRTGPTELCLTPAINGQQVPDGKGVAYFPDAKPAVIQAIGPGIDDALHKPFKAPGGRAGEVPEELLLANGVLKEAKAVALGGFGSRLREWFLYHPLDPRAPSP